MENLITIIVDQITNLVPALVPHATTNFPACTFARNAFISGDSLFVRGQSCPAIGATDRAAGRHRSDLACKIPTETRVAETVNESNESGASVLDTMNTVQGEDDGLRVRIRLETSLHDEIIPTDPISGQHLETNLVHDHGLPNHSRGLVAHSHPKIKPSIKSMDQTTHLQLRRRNQTSLRPAS